VFGKRQSKRRSVSQARAPGIISGSVKDEVIADRYELEGLVGTGGMSSVYKARDRLLERRVALKVLHPHHASDEDFVERFRKEARLVAQLSHPNIVTVIDRGDDDGRQFIVFELIEGENLKEVVTREGPLPLRRAVELALQVGHGLAFAHSHGLVHRDVKPQNVLMNGDDQAKVTDFGIARSIDVDVSVTQTGTVLGTSAYIAPEQASGGDITPQTDVYSLGVVLYELLTGEVPFPGESFVAVAMKHINDPAPSVLDRRPETPTRLAAAVDRALAKEPGERFASMDEFVAELSACLAELGPEADADATMIVPAAASRAARASRPPRGVRVPAGRPAHSPWPLLVPLIVVAAALGAVGLYFAVTRTNVGNLGGSSPPARSARSVHLAGVGAWDPQGGDGEHDSAAPNATDGNPATYWGTEHYRSFDKPGVGVVLEVHSARQLKSVTVTSDTPGFTAEIQAGHSAQGPFATVSTSRVVGDRTRFPIESSNGAKFYLVWITQLPPGSDTAHVNEVSAAG
jgi:eukaryotic-like serine/threonine-protein kinase